MGEPWERPTGRAVGRIINDETAAAAYVDHLLATVSNPLKGLKIVVDCANGASSLVAPAIYEKAGATVIAIHHSPDGWNINDGCGSTHLEDLQAAVIREGADFGSPHDVDSDRCLAVDGTGAVVDGDQIMTILAIGFKNRGKLKSETIVATVMSNLGFFHAMKSAGINVITTSVGDRYVLEKMLEGDYSLGGEQSGHLIIREHAGTGDGILTALALAQEVISSGKSLAELASAMQRFPQVLINVPNVAKDRLAESTAISTAVGDAEKRLGDEGRVLLRASGTEPLIRVMVEASSDSLAQEIASSLAAVVKAELGN
jgi:phosphoglucosamine mutase